MKIIDIETKGNLVRFILGSDDIETWYGDDWDDVPYEHNAGPVYDRFVENTVDYAFSWNCVVIEPKDDWRFQSNSPYAKDDMRERKVPCLVIVPSEDEMERSTFENEFQRACANDRAIKFYHGDELGEKLSEVIEAGGKVSFSSYSGCTRD